MNIRVVELCPEFLPCPPKRGGAIESYVYGISKSMGKLGAEIHLVTIEKRQDVDYSGIYVHTINLSNPIAIKFSARAKEFNNIITESIKVFKKIEDLYGEVDIIHNHYFTTSFAPLVYKYLKKGNIAIVGHIHNEPKPNRVNKALIEAYDAHLAVSKYIKDRTVELLGVNPSKIGVAYNAVDTEFFKPCNPSEKIEKRKALKIEDTEFVIAFIGRIVPEKGLHHLLLASNLLKQRGYKFQLLIAGPMGHFDMESLEGYPKTCLDLVSHFDLVNNVKYLGGLKASKVRDVYCISNLVVVPSIGVDACPSVVLEALAMGKPVVAYASGGIPELIPPYGGVVVRNREPRYLAEVIEMVIGGSVAFNEAATVEWVRSKFSYPVIAQKLLKIFARMRSQVI